jgi:hypothetical protein
MGDGDPYPRHTSANASCAAITIGSLRLGFVTRASYFSFQFRNSCLQEPDLVGCRFLSFQPFGMSAAIASVWSAEHTTPAPWYVMPAIAVAVPMAAFHPLL